MSKKAVTLWTSGLAVAALAVSPAASAAGAPLPQPDGTGAGAGAGAGAGEPAEGATSSPHDRIAFVWANFEFTEEEIATVRADGSEYTILTNEEGLDVAPEYSPDGSQIAFTSSRSMPPGFPGEPRFYSELYLMDADGSNVRQVTFSEGVIDFQPAWSPDGRQIVIARGPGTAPPEGQLTAPTDLWIIDLPSGQELQLTDSPETWEGWPDWSPDGKRIAFEGDMAEPGNSDVYTIRTDGSDLQRLTSQASYEGDAHYSPDGRWIVFDSDRTGNVDVFVMRDDGAPVRQLTDDPGEDFAGGYSADGKFIAFSSDRDSTSGIPDIFRMRANGTQETNLTNTPDVIEFDPTWQP